MRPLVESYTLDESIVHSRRVNCLLKLVSGTVIVECA